MQIKNTKSVFNHSKATLKFWCIDNGLPVVPKDTLTGYRSLCLSIYETFGYNLWERKYPPVRLYRDMMAGTDYVHPVEVSRLVRALVRLKRITS